MKAKIFVGPAYSGKTRTAQMISEYIGKDKSVFIDGRDLIRNPHFAFEEVSSNTELLIIDECPKNFSFERFYDVEYDENNQIKGYYFLVNKRITPPKRYSIPKVIIITDFYPEITGASLNRRFEIIEFPICDLSKIKTEE